MNTERFFWKTWSRDYRFLFLILVSIFIVAIVFAAYNFIHGNDQIINWEKFQEQKSIESTLHEFQLGPFTLSIPAENFVISEYFNGSFIHPNTIASHLYLCLFAFATILLLAIISTLERFWFIVCGILTMLFIYSLRLYALSPFGLNNQIPAVVFSVLIIGTGAVFNMFRKETSFIFRLLIFAVLVGGIGAVLYFYSSVPIPFQHLAVTSYSSSLVATVLFILLVSHEIPAAFVVLIGRNTSGGKSLQHLIVITVIYLINLALAVSYEIGIIDWNFIYINAYLLLGVSAIVGLWGFRNRETLYENILPFHPFGALLYLSLGIIAIGTIGNLLGNMNDAALYVVRAIILFSHLGFGILFFFYTISNFIDLLGKNTSIEKILYKPTRMPYFTFQLAGLIATLGFVFFVGWRNYASNAMSGFYTELGDLDVSLSNEPFAVAHYEKANTYGFRNHHAHYALAQLKLHGLNYEQAHFNYKQANGNGGSEFSQINQGNVYIWENETYKALHQYHQALKKFPSSGRLENNLGFAYGKILNLDSATYFLSKAKSHAYSQASAEANYFALVALSSIPVKADSILQTFETTYVATQANALALANAQQQKFETTLTPFQNKKLDLYSATLLNNYLVRHAKTMDSTEVKIAYAIANDSLNADYSEALKVAVASVYYFQQNVKEALSIMAELAFMSQSYKGNYNYLQGLWALEQGNYETASTYFGFAVAQAYKKAKLYQAIAFTEGGELTKARVAWDSLATHGDQNEQQLATAINTVLMVPSSVATSLPDPIKYQFCRYRLSVHDTTFFDKLIPSFSSDDYKAQALYDMTKRQFKWGHLHKAIVYLNQVSGSTISDKKLYESIRHLELLMLAERKEIRKLANQINEGLEFDSARQLEKLLFAALINEEAGDTISAQKNYNVLASYNPYFEEGVIAAASFYKRHSENALKSYSILAEAIQVNTNSPRLLAAYIKEAKAVGFDEYAESAATQLRELLMAREVN